jgi:hypothetical protein
MYCASRLEQFLKSAKVVLALNSPALSAKCREKEALELLESDIFGAVWGSLKLFTLILDDFTYKLPQPHADQR